MKGANTSGARRLHTSHLRGDSVVVRVLQHQHVDADAAQVPAQALQHVVTHHPQILGLHGGSALHAVPCHTLVLIAHVPAGTLTSLETSQTPTLGLHNNSRSLVQLLGIYYILTHLIEQVLRVNKTHLYTQSAAAGRGYKPKKSNTCLQPFLSRYLVRIIR